MEQDHEMVAAVRNCLNLRSVSNGTLMYRELKKIGRQMGITEQEHLRNFVLLMLLLQRKKIVSERKIS